MATYDPAVYPMPPPNADLATTWAFLEEGVDHIMNRTQGDCSSYPKYIALYTVMYNYCTSCKTHGGGETLGMAGRSEFSLIHAPLRFLFQLPFRLTWLADNDRVEKQPAQTSWDLICTIISSVTS